MLEQPGVDTFLMKSVGTRDDPQLLQEKIKNSTVNLHALSKHKQQQIQQ